MLIVEAAAPYAAAVKPNLAFFEAFGSAGIAALERIRAALPDELPVIADAKRGDIGTTAARQAVALFDASARTRSPSTRTSGARPIAPLLERPDRFAYVLCRTSNPGAAELQDLRGRRRPRRRRPAEPLHLRVARRAATWGRAGRWGSSSAPPRPRSWRRSGAIAPGLAFLVPGVGAQGGDVEPVLAARSGDGGAGRRAARRRARSSTCRAGIAGAARDAAAAEPFGTSATLASCRRMGRQAPCATVTARIGPSSSHAHAQEHSPCRTSEPPNWSSSWSSRS